MEQRLTLAVQSLNNSLSLRELLLQSKISEIIEIVGPAITMRDHSTDLMSFRRLMQSANEQQIDLLIHILNHIVNSNLRPLKLFINGPAGSGKTFAIQLIQAVYNKFAKNEDLFNTYVTCASTGQGAKYINGGTVHTTLKIGLSENFERLSELHLKNYRLLFKDVKVIIIDQINMIGRSLLRKIDCRLKEITGNGQVSFGGLDVILIGDLRQLPPIRDLCVWQQSRSKCTNKQEKSPLWRDFNCYDFEKIAHQGNEVFSELLTTIGNGDILTTEQKSLIEARFFSIEEANRLCPEGIHLFQHNFEVERYNNDANGNRAKAIHKSIGETFDSIVYHYSKRHELSLVYVAISRVKTLQGLHIVSNDGDFEFFHCRETNASVLALKEELSRLTENKLAPIDAALKADLRKQLLN